ncbi:putative membrane protein [Comamonas odontotermitis]|uniref:Membrane protein n=1 Tax=Comamonas odontotermitis TaxID=379895 RepID=A0ABR6RIY5_9BURK|nr:hypothetical protein [Comamonas odontotermitis]MBB6578979.1 putative membrane protein [Comamonas odontotermitis]
MTDETEALRLADLLDINYHEPHVEQAAAAELRRLSVVEATFDEWLAKTEWVQRTAKPSELGLHRADVMANRIAALEAELSDTRAQRTASNRRIEEQFAEIERLRTLAATCYAGLGGECDLPVIWLDALNDAANGEPFDTDGLLPYTSAIRAQLTTQTNRAAAAEQQVTALTQRLDTANALNTEARNQLADMGNPITQCNQQVAQCQSPAGGQWKCGNEYLPYHPDASHVDPSYRDGWNDCYLAAPPPPEREPLSNAWYETMLVCQHLDESGKHPKQVWFKRSDVIRLIKKAEATHGIGATND